MQGYRRLTITKNEYSAFEPVVMLHHANTDRLFTIWQIIWPVTCGGNTFAMSLQLHRATRSARIAPLGLFTIPGTVLSGLLLQPVVPEVGTICCTYPQTANNSASCAFQAENYLCGPSADKATNNILSAGKHSIRDGPLRPGLNYGWLTNMGVVQDALNPTTTVHVLLVKFRPNPKN